ncbi:MAG: hypothetical protein U5R06_09810 [candidate division KSB1 bacterium]|nr:hypothetical protein [candidate division KSB1 bacterium]
MKTKIQVALILLLIFTGIVFSKGNIETAQLSALDVLRAKYQNNIQVNWNESIGTPDIITFQKPIDLGDKNEKSVNAFLVEIQQLIDYRTKLDSLVYFKQKEHRGRQFCLIGSATTVLIVRENLFFTKMFISQDKRDHLGET